MIQFPDTLKLVGQKLGPYVVRQVATMGGVAIIYQGEHEALHSAVAIKVLTPELVEDAVRPTLEQMFLREAQILSQLRSDDILRALDHGQVVCGDGKERPYIVVDWMDGRPLSEDIDRRRLEGLKAYDIGEAIETLEPIARALAYAHGNGIVHRDVNPRNVFLENVGGGKPRAKLIDFGFAKEVARTEALRLQNVDGTLMARSPDYAAPEHYDRETFGELSENTDIYTFALMIVEMLTLQPPLHGASDAELQIATANRADRPTPNRRGAHVSDSVEKLFSEALAVDQFDRPGVLLDWWERLKTAVSGDGQTVPAASPAAGPTPPAGAAAPEVSSPTIDVSGPSIEVFGDASEPPRPDERIAPRPSDDDFPQNWGAPAPATGRLARGIAISLAGVLVVGGAFGAFLWYQHRPLDCPSGSGDCNGNHSDGCETNLLQDAARCGACGHPCAAGEVCTEGKCQSGRCPLDHLRDCNRVASDGCEVDMRTDSKNCGECGKVCGQSGAKQAACVDAACEISCRPGFGNCDDAPENGCEALFSTDAKHCGRCGFACVNATCGDGVCAPKLLVGPLRIQSLHARGDTLYFWDADDRRIDRVTVDGLRGTVADHVDDLTGLVATADRIIWSGGSKNEIFTRPLDGGPITRVSGPLTSNTPIFISTAGYVSWSNRARRSDEPTGSSGRARAALSPPPTPRTILFAPVEGLSDKARVATADCNQWPASFAGGPDGQYCCDRKQPVTLVECKGTNCAYRPLAATCPDVFADDGDRIYFAEETRVVALGRKSAKLDVLAKRKRQPRAVTVGGDYVYWLEGEPISDIFRIKKDAKDPTLAEMIARRQVDAVELSASNRAAFWTARAPADAASAKGAKPAAQKGSKPGQAGHGAGAPNAAYVVVFPTD